MSAPKKLDLTIVIPAYSEEKRIGSTLNSLAFFLKEDDFFGKKAIEVIVVVADAPDRTHRIVVDKGRLFNNFRLLKSGPKVGKGRDVQLGVLGASSKMVIYMDADLSTPLHHLEKFYKTCEKTGDVVIGTRNLLRHHPNPLRRMISNAGNVLFRIVGGVWVEDSQCGFKIFDNHSAQLCFSKLKIMGWGFDMEILAIARANGLKIQSYRINDWKDMPHSTFTEGLIKISIRSLKDLGFIGMHRIKGTYLNKNMN